MQFTYDRDFDTDFDYRPANVPGSGRVGAIYTKEEFDAAVKAARVEGYQDGRISGRAEAMTATAESEAERQVAALEALAPALTALFRDADRHHAVLEAQMLQFIMSVFEQLAPDVAATLARGQAEREAGEAIRMALGSAVLRLALPPEVVRQDADEIKRRARLAGFGGRVEIESDGALAVGDLRAEWDHGVLTYSFNEICQKVMSALHGAGHEAEHRAEKRPDDGNGQNEAED
ncbi:hypothetical protein ATO6_20405 [Oceanicola sp. 22II-s10i]|uniref:FliH/SctL family protein n=1 Tax=Oceanicola sp. 22II-s10i TaxID=1317116 RepID=UPI000B523844|nr:hypothetical protein [Oceanicola sp. 22II-s10i]OWU83201.1 hypothetical protein ATO6_20405 [Oceanicola sp. 22II-s10i]